jgi:hypothetical protein
MPTAPVEANGTSAGFDPDPSSVYTVANGINPAGAITGNYTDANGTHGFLRIPAHQDE